MYYNAPEGLGLRKEAGFMNGLRSVGNWLARPFTGNTPTPQQQQRENNRQRQMQLRAQMRRLRGTPKATMLGELGNVRIGDWGEGVKGIFSNPTDIRGSYGNKPSLNQLGLEHIKHIPDVTIGDIMQQNKRNLEPFWGFGEWAVDDIRNRWNNRPQYQPGRGVMDASPNYQKSNLNGAGTAPRGAYQR